MAQIMRRQGDRLVNTCCKPWRVDDSTKPFHLRFTAIILLGSADSDALLSTLTLLDFDGIQEFALICGISDISDSILKSTSTSCQASANALINVSKTFLLSTLYFHWFFIVVIPSFVSLASMVKSGRETKTNFRQLIIFFKVSFAHLLHNSIQRHGAW